MKTRLTIWWYWLYFGTITVIKWPYRAVMRKFFWKKEVTLCKHHWWGVIYKDKPAKACTKCDALFNIPRREFRKLFNETPAHYKERMTKAGREYDLAKVGQNAAG